MNWATRSLPVPLSPVIRTVPLERAMREAERRRSSVRWLLAMNSGASMPISSLRR